MSILSVIGDFVLDIAGNFLKEKALDVATNKSMGLLLDVGGTIIDTNDLDPLLDYAPFEWLREVVERMTDSGVEVTEDVYNKLYDIVLDNLPETEL